MSASADRGSPVVMVEVREYVLGVTGPLMMPLRFAPVVRNGVAGPRRRTVRLDDRVEALQ